MSRDKLWSLIGGIHPKTNKLQSTGKPIGWWPTPTQILLPLIHSNGAIATPCVSIGERVKAGQLVATFNIPVSTRIHSSINGVVVAEKSQVIAHSSGLEAPCLVIESDPKMADDLILLPEISEWDQEENERLIERIDAAGINGLGGAGFPTQIKYQSRAPIHTLIVNGIECEPYITADDMIMQEHAKEILEGVLIGVKLLNAKQVLFAIEDNKPSAIKAIKAAIEQLPAQKIKQIQLKIVPTKYPSGSEKQLIYILTGQQVPSGNIPSSLGLLVQNVGTLFAMQQAVCFGKPLTHRVVTLTGKNASQPGNYWVPIGTPISEIHGHQTDQSSQKVIMGGPMMGFEVPDITAPITKSTNCLIFPDKSELGHDAEENPCIRCGLCEQACPIQLLPQQLLWNTKNHEWERAELNSLFDCIECGACSWVCPSNIPLVQYYRSAKAEIKREHLEKVRSDQSRQRFENRQERLEKEIAEKEIKRKQRAAAAAKAQAAKKDPGESALNDNAKADILASIARVKALKANKASIKSDPSPVDAEALKIAYEKAEEIVLKAKVKLEKAEQENSSAIPALKTALSKLEDRANIAKEKWQLAQKSPAKPDEG